MDDFTRNKVGVGQGKIRNSVLAMSGLRCRLDIHVEMWNNQSLELRGKVQAGDINFSAVSVWMVFKAG